jgi:luciferase family oxidoreductase group 1
LGSSSGSAKLAAALGLPFVFAAQVTPNELMNTIGLYRERFKPSKQRSAPYVTICINAVGADTDREAERCFTSIQRGLVSFFRGGIGQVQPPIDDINALWTAQEKQTIEHMFRLAIVGSPKTVETKLRDFFAATKADEVMITGNIYDPAARLRSLEVIAEAGARI